MRVLLALVTLAAAATHLTAAWDQQPDGYEVLDGPADHESFDAWHQAWASWRSMELRANRYERSDACNVYNLPQAQWTQRSFVQVLLMLNDRAIYDRERDEYTVDKYVDAMEARVGKLDSVLIWSSYPNIGIDNRNQWDLLRTLPGGLAGVKTLVEQFQKRGIRVLITYNPWDTATRGEPGFETTVRMYTADIAMLAKIVAETHVDGFNGDTMYGVPKSFYNCSQPLLATPEGGVPTAFLSHNPISWGYFLGYANFPPVSRAKFLESRHMVQVCGRWSQNKMVELQMAFFNGIGYVVWENVWGIWNAMTAREDEAAKRIFAILRQFAFATVSAEWRPYAFGSRQAKVVASEFPVAAAGNSTSSGHRGWFYTIISMADHDTTFRLSLSTAQLVPGTKVYDVYHGTELTPFEAQDASRVVEVALEPFGFGAIYVAASGAVAVDGLNAFLATMRAMTATRLESFSMTRPLLQQTLVGFSSSATADTSDPYGFAPAAPAPVIHNSSDNIIADDSDMVYVRGSASWWFNVSGVQIEPVVAWTPTWRDFGTGVQFPWERRPSNVHAVRLAIQDFRIDRHPVTNAAYARFLRASQYKPTSLERFLAHWNNRIDSVTGALTPVSEWRVPPALAQTPVVYVAREDADAFARFYHKRLPHDWEWQYVASNGDQYDLFPWGRHRVLNDTDLPRVSRGTDLPVLDAVGSHPRARSTAFGVDDLVGYVWQMTDQFCDEHTCGQLLRGGSAYQPVASTLGDPNWYFPQALAATQHNRLLMTSVSYDRSPMISFRCATSV